MHTTTIDGTDRGRLELNEEECKGCGLCVEACPTKVLSLAARLNHCSYHPVTYRGHGCTGCGICFLVCPEPGAIKVFCAVRVQPEGASQCASN
jgi:2-oxoglutarate ferredoxin oxidoreductase subunit delta